MCMHQIIGISGVTCAGKTTLAEKLVNHFGTNCVLISQDEFYLSEDDPNHEWVEVSPGIKHQNWENVSSIDWQTFIKRVNEIRKKKVCETSVKLILIEGHLIFNYRLLSEMCHKKFFLTLDKNECFERRNVRTYLPKDPDGYFESWVWPMFLKNFNKMKEYENEVPIGIQINYKMTLNAFKSRFFYSEFLDGNCDQNILFNTVIKSLEQLKQ